MSIKREKVKLLIPDASPLISLAHGGEDCLELIFKANLPVVMTDQVLFEATYRKDDLRDAALSSPYSQVVPETQDTHQGHRDKDRRSKKSTGVCREI